VSCSKPQFMVQEVKVCPPFPLERQGHNIQLLFKLAQRLGMGGN
jgi:hypothetical protein